MSGKQQEMSAKGREKLHHESCFLRQNYKIIGLKEICTFNTPANDVAFEKVSHKTLFMILIDVVSESTAEFKIGGWIRNRE